MNNLKHQPRQITSVVIEGIDRSTPDDIVKDGKCEELHNLRFVDGAWRPTHPPTYKRSFSNVAEDAKIVYRHPAAPEGQYILETYHTSPTSHYAYSVIGAKSNTSLLSGSKCSISHFGNVLILHNDEVIKYYLLGDDGYTKVSLPQLPPITIEDSPVVTRIGIPPAYVKVNTNIYIDAPTVGSRPITWAMDTWYAFTESPNTLTKLLKDITTHINNGGTRPKITCRWILSDAKTKESLIPTALTGLDPDTPLNQSWHGEMALFASLVLNDGTPVNPSSMHIHITNNDFSNVTLRQETLEDHGSVICADKVFDCSESVPSYSELLEQSVVSYGVPRISFPEWRESINTDLIKGVAIWATRINPIFDASHTLVNDGTLTTAQHYADNKLPEQPMYLVKEFPLSTDDGIYGPFSLDLTLDTMESVVHNRVYAPNNMSAHSAGATLDFNSRLHLGNVTTRLVDDPLLTSAIDTPDDMTANAYRVCVSVPTSDSRHYKVGNSLRGTSLAKPYDRIITYHDYRADSVIFDPNFNGSRYGVNLSPAAGNNLAYYYRMTAAAKYAPLAIADMEVTDGDVTIRNNPIIKLPNRIYVSEANNCLVYPFANSYAVGSEKNRIIAMQSAALEMPEMKVGEMPLYVFTEEGIFALIAGSETLYARVSAVNYDKVINPHTLAINGAIVYITDKGVHLLTNSGSQLISAPLNDRSGTPPLDLLREGYLCQPREHSEIMLCRDGDDIAYIFNLDNGYWSTRSLSGTVINTNEVVSRDDTAQGVVNISNLDEEDSNYTNTARILTRPIKLGNVEFKRIETFIPRFATNDDFANITIDLQGSVDGSSYMPLRHVQVKVDYDRLNPLIIRRTPFSAKYFTVSMYINPTSDSVSHSVSITHFDIEWYNKLRHRMR